MSRSALHATAALLATPVAIQATVCTALFETALAAPAVPPTPVDPTTLVKLDQIDALIADAGRIGGVLHLTPSSRPAPPQPHRRWPNACPNCARPPLAAAIEFARLRACCSPRSTSSVSSRLLTPRCGAWIRASPVS